jgi:hypothetical protein
METRRLKADHRARRSYGSLGIPQRLRKPQVAPDLEALRLKALAALSELRALGEAQGWAVPNTREAARRYNALRRDSRLHQESVRVPRRPPVGARKRVATGQPVRPARPEVRTVDVNRQLSRDSGERSEPGRDTGMVTGRGENDWWRD